MRDTMIKNGDIVIGSSGNTVLLEGTDAKFQQAVLCISAKLGGFVYDRNLGSKVLLQDKHSRQSRLNCLPMNRLQKWKIPMQALSRLAKRLRLTLRLTILQGRCR